MLETSLSLLGIAFRRPIKLSSGNESTVGIALRQDEREARDDLNKLVDSPYKSRSNPLQRSGKIEREGASITLIKPTGLTSGADIERVHKTSFRETSRKPKLLMIIIFIEAVLFFAIKKMYTTNREKEAWCALKACV